jgi:hypothetical protein
VALKTRESDGKRGEKALVELLRAAMALNES